TPNIKGVICVMMERRGCLDHVKKVISRSQIVALLGSSQCGKMTLARRNEESNLTKAHHGLFIDTFRK
ncbi:MAG: hypothetical protein ACTSR4_09390, partial [Candidatus Hodarchaeales archaeon]